MGVGTTTDLSNMLNVYKSDGAGISIGSATEFLRLTGAGGLNYIQSGANETSDSGADLVFGTVFAGTEWGRFDATNGNFGIGSSTPNWALSVTGTTTTSGLRVDDNCVGCVPSSSWASTTTFAITSDYTDTVNFGFAPKMYSGYAYLKGNSDGDIYCQFQGGSAYSSNIQSDGGINSGAVCTDDAGTDQLSVKIQNFTSTGFDVFWDHSAGAEASASIIQLTVIGN